MRPDELQAAVEASGSLAQFREPVLFDLPEGYQPPFRSHKELLECCVQGLGCRWAGAAPTLRCSNALSCPVAAQFGPVILAEERDLAPALEEGLFAQATAEELLGGEGGSDEQCPMALWPVRLAWLGLPLWLRGTSGVLSAGRAGSGVAFHVHAVAWLLLLSGEKLWFLYPPSGPNSGAYARLALCPAEGLPEAVEGLNPEERPLVVRQRAGEGLLVPQCWWHATLNLTDTLAVGAQLTASDIQLPRALEEHSGSAFVQYQLAASSHVHAPGLARWHLDRVVRQERHNYFYAWQQVELLYETAPRKMLRAAMQVCARVRAELSPQQQQLVYSRLLPTVLDMEEALLDRHGPLEEVTRAADLARDLVGSLSDALQAPGAAPGINRIATPTPTPAPTWSRRSCAECGRGDLGGRPGEGEWAACWYCVRCWREFQERPAECQDFTPALTPGASASADGHPQASRTAGAVQRRTAPTEFEAVD